MATNTISRARSNSNIVRASKVNPEESSKLLPPASPTDPLLSKKPQRFLSRSSGMFRVNRKGAKRLFISYFKTGYHALIDMNWFLFLACLITFYLMSFAFFGVIYYILSESMGCIEHVSNWPEAFFFSIQTGMTIGYGSMYPDGCRTIIYAVLTQSIFGLISDALVLGLAFEKVG